MIFLRNLYDEKYLLSRVETLIAVSQQGYEDIELKRIDVNFEGGTPIKQTISIGDLIMESVSYREVSQVNNREDGFVSGKGRILIMDDEDLIRDVAEEMLSKLGYEVSGAQDGTEAIELYKDAMESGKPYDAVIMDLTIPGGMGGTEAIKRLHEIDPAVKAIVSSGYSNDQIISEHKEHGFSAYIAKPYRFTELSRIVHQVVTGSGV